MNYILKKWIVLWIYFTLSGHCDFELSARLKIFDAFANLEVTGFFKAFGCCWFGSILLNYWFCFFYSFQVCKFKACTLSVALLSVCVCVCVSVFVCWVWVFKLIIIWNLMMCIFSHKKFYTLFFVLNCICNWTHMRIHI